jgi:hypothetical protein
MPAAPVDVTEETSDDIVQTEAIADGLFLLNYYKYLGANHCTNQHVSIGNEACAADTPV